MERLYRLEDEPTPGALSWVAVNPVWPLLALMLAGAWLSWPWFALNALALGSPTRGREIAVALLAFATTALLLLMWAFLASEEALPPLALRLLLLGVVLWKLGLAYALWLLQSRTFELYRHYGGPVHTGLYVLLGAAFLGRARLLEAVHPFLRLLLA